jgi:hypothetical protein
MNVRGWPAGIMCICLGAVLLAIIGQPGSSKSAPTNQNAFNAENDQTEQHEANGPEGAQGLPMQRLSRTGVCLAGVLLLASGGLVAMRKKSNSAFSSVCAKEK